MDVAAIAALALILVVGSVLARAWWQWVARTPTPDTDDDDDNHQGRPRWS